MSVLFKRWEEIRDVKRVLADRDWFPATSGNISIKVSDNPVSFLVSASGKDKSKETVEDFLLVDANGKALLETDLRPSAETLLHIAVYKESRAGCVLHVHTVENNVISSLYGEEGVVHFTDQEIIKALGIWEEDGEISVPIIPNYADIPKLTEAFRPHIQGDSGAVLIRHHGITVWGRDAFEAKRHLEAYEFLFRFHLQSRQFASK
ncbi:methylthioribulose 1-phosphate dehydratase [Priestia taiwanensis]|uniref:Methylthioribulose-1-phosphate dehydratase n=1 Tax=Priestia taiwanensis TaxID=1347902 RepID=A0A917ARG2_9BACI|nr:methylthioribulose 1-phosphate dehydratase [Priestia taiwanensis]MBM7363239.1 methylthioribulose-1-phosphate dehydratase [Priestia taiwanensis]GGE68831.1 methylthioribulose-1-phosphate dehydratase [Priestia taiwanensis]